jgi:hypothetical protein
MMTIGVLIAFSVLLIAYMLSRVLQNYIMYTHRGYTPIPESEKAVLSPYFITKSKDSVEILIDNEARG